MLDIEELNLREKNYLIMEDDRLRKLSMAKTLTEKIFLRSQLCEIRGLLADNRSQRLGLKFKG
tara:strand:+ start:285 stop:473 length:189 start_codon:yes stop_codon:yes gene_type:complete